MKKILTLFSFLTLSAICSQAQMFWVENFEGGSTSGLVASSYTGPNGPWTITVTGTEGAFFNQWYVSCEENGHTTGVCGTGCVAVSSTATLSTLHIGTTFPTADNGATYFASSLSATDRRANSPTINCTGRYTINLSFYYIENGELTDDNATVWYSPDNGATWSLLDDPAKTAPICPGGQGMWTHYTYSLPSSANNNPTVKIGFRWVNDNDAIGTDPSFAVDSVSLTAGTSTTAPTPAFTTSSSTACEGDCVTFTNTTTGSIDSFRWTASPSVSIPSPTSSPVTICFTTAATYSVTLTAWKSGTSYPVTHTVTVNPAPAPIVGSHSVCVGNSTPLSDATIGGSWSSSNVAVVTIGSGSGVATGVSAGTATITYSLPTGCMATITFTVFPLPCNVSVPESSSPAAVEIFPNPASEELYINTPAGYSAFVITNEIGQSVARGVITGSGDKADIRLLPQGVYYITVRGANGSVVRKFIKS